MKHSLRFLVLTPLLALLAGCCANSPCDCQDLLEDSLYLTLNQNASLGNTFTDAELDTVYLLRYNPATAGRTYDSIPVLRYQRRSKQLVSKLKSANADTTSVVLSNASPFTPGTTGGNISNYYYALVVKASRSAPRYVFNLNQIQIKGQYNADGCCTCYKNTLKTVSVNGTPVDVTESGGLPKPIRLFKP